MSGKKQLTKQRVTYGSLGDSNSRENEEFPGQQSIGKRVSFEAPSLSSDDDDDDDSNVEVAFGRNNRTSGKRDSFDVLFRESSFGDRQSSVRFEKGSEDGIIAKGTCLCLVVMKMTVGFANVARYPYHPVSTSYCS